jgi:hypothetical protein
VKRHEKEMPAGMLPNFDRSRAWPEASLHDLLRTCVADHARSQVYAFHKHTYKLAREANTLRRGFWAGYSQGLNT